MLRNIKCVLVVAPSRNTKGGISYVIRQHELCCYWDKWGCKWIESYKDGSVYDKIYYFLKGFFNYLFYMPSASIVHIHFSADHSMIRKSAFFFVAKVMKKKIVMHLHYGIEGLLKTKWYSLYKYIFFKSDIVVFLSDNIRRRVLEDYGYFESVIVYNPAPKVIVKEALKKKYILFVGALKKEKGCDDLIKAFSIISRKCQDWRLVMLGDGNVERLRSIAKEMGVIEKVKFTGWIDGNKKEKYFEEADIFCLPSYAEGFSMAILEAFAYGLPIVATPVGGLSDFINHRKNGMLHEVGDINSLASCIYDLIEDESLRMSLANESKKMSLDRFGVNHICDSIDGLYEKLIR